MMRQSTCTHDKTCQQQYALVHTFRISRKGGTGGGGWQGSMHMVAARLGCQRAVVGTGWANSCPGCMDRFRKHYSQGVHFWQGKLPGSEQVYDNREC